MDELERQIQAELSAIATVLTELTGLPSRWSGKVGLVPEAEFRGKKLFRCDILIDAALAQRPERWSTLIHEVLHSLSVDYNNEDYQRFRGWEEGVVEQLQRLYRTQILQRLSIDLTDNLFAQEGNSHAYNRFIRALENLRRAVKVSDDEQVRFYRSLLAVPIKQRPAWVRSLGPASTGEEWVEFVKVFSAANSVLKG